MGKNAGILFKSDEHVLLIKRSAEIDDSHTWAIPGGQPEEGESPEETAKREAKEELGVMPESTGTSQKIETPEFVTFVHDVSEDEMDNYYPKLNWESEDWGWFSTDDLPSPLHKNVKLMFRQLEDTAHNNGFQLSEEMYIKTSDDSMKTMKDFESFTNFLTSLGLYEAKKKSKSKKKGMNPLERQGKGVIDKILKAHKLRHGKISRKKSDDGVLLRYPVKIKKKQQVLKSYIIFATGHISLMLWDKSESQLRDIIMIGYLKNKNRLQKLGKDRLAKWLD